MKKLNEIIKNHSAYKKDDVRVKNKIDFKKYIKKEKSFSFKKLIPVSIVFLFLFVLTGIVISNFDLSKNTIKREYTIEQRKEISKIVYNSAILDNEEYEPFAIDYQKLKGKKSNSTWYYTDLRVTSSFMFQVEMNCSLEPFFSMNLTGKVVDIVVANIELKSIQKRHDDDWWFGDQMIIITYQREIIGFTSPGLYDYHYETEGYLDDFTDLYSFGSYVFLTEDAVVKYYKKGDMIYSLYVNAKDKNNIIFSCIGGHAFENDDVDYGSVSMLEGSYAELNSEYTLSLIEQSMVKEIETSATVLYVEDGTIYVSSEITPSLKSITLFTNGSIFINGKVQSDGNVTLYENNIIEFSYYQRYQDYKPVDIYVSYINVVL